ncbi:CHAP domain-containing protein [Novosphingobium mangrovi (ex Hu et al. 2023)]|uniref:CHAP domain-containing protein n=1 Tax=Novosphingobium mangrovi (ex Hu et al. 2023) TaxID=2930094 RepID=A0ABT0ACH5_9SPHN|nr:CHAP domain-containing protein [Novosphingobium mangrovi (ex Hu et al. 2023)]MCJ1960908.1 CHAP domain-containing protein [Novosphingobium mangrovi (ex Hu et al. 2023)]
MKFLTGALRRTFSLAPRKAGANNVSGRLAQAVSALLATALALTALPASAHVLQCVPYARAQSGISIHGNARTWWKQAAGTYARGAEPEVGAVMAMAPSHAMPYGHVAVVSKIVDTRHVLLNHANWSRPGMIERGVLAEDVSDAGDWSEVRVWFAPIGALGSRHNPVYGFIYPEAPDAEAAPTLELAEADTATRVASAAM